METLKIALLQIAPCGTLGGTLEKWIASCRKAKELDADIALFPEMWSNGYNIYDRPVDQWKAEAIPADSEFVSAFGQLARELDMAIGITFLEQYEGGPRNSMVLFDRFGERTITYAPLHQREPRPILLIALSVDAVGLIGCDADVLQHLVLLPELLEVLLPGAVFQNFGTPA